MSRGDDPAGPGDGPANRQGSFVALGFRDFRRIWVAQFVAQIGFWLLVTARAVLVFDITGSAQALGVIYFFTFVPQLLLGPHSGVLADRFDRRQIIIASQVVQVAGTAAMGLLAATDTATLFNLSALSVLVGSMHVVGLPASNALMPSLVGRDALSSAVTLSSAIQQVSRVVGPLGAAALIPLFGVSALFYGNALTGLAVVVAWWLTPVSANLKTDMEERSAFLRRGFAAVRRAADLWSPIVVIAVLNAVGLIYQPLGVAYATDILAGGDTDRGAWVFGILQAVLGAGAVLGVLASGPASVRRPGDSFALSALGFSLALVALGAVDAIVLALIAAALLGGFHFANVTIAMNLVQHQVEERLRGRVMAIFGLAFTGAFPISSAVAGSIADAASVPATFVGAGLICTAFSLYALRWRKHIFIDGPEASATRARGG